MSGAGLSERARLLRIEDTRRDEPGLLDSLMRDADPAMRARAALTAGRLGGRAHLTPLRALLADRDTGVVASAFFALGLLKDTASVAAAGHALRAGEGVAREAAWLLGEVGEPARDVIVRSLADSMLTAGARGALLVAATRLRPAPGAAAVPWLSSANPEVAWRAAYLIARGRSAAGARALLALAGSPHAAMREQVARGGSRALTGDSLASIAVRALGVLVTDHDAHVRVNAVRALSTHGAPAARLVRERLTDADASVRLAAAQSLDAVSDSSAESFLPLFTADTALVVQQAIGDAMARRGLAPPMLRAWSTSQESARRAIAAGWTGRGPAAGAVARLAATLRDPDGRVRAAAAGALVTLRDSTSVRDSVRVMLRALARDPDVGVRTVAMQALAHGAHAEDLRAGLAGYRIAIADADNDARLAFWQLADSASRHLMPLPDDIATELDHLAMPPEPLERAAAARVARFAAWRDIPGTARPMSWYEERAAEAAEAVGRRPVARVETERGTMELELFVADAPMTVHNFVSLARRGYFDGTRFHRVVPNFVAQGGDPRGDGSGGPGYAIRDELNRHRYGRGAVGMALSGPHTGGSQFFVTHSPQPHLDGGYTVFGRLRAGEDVLDRIVQGDRIVRITIR